MRIIRVGLLLGMAVVAAVVPAPALAQRYTHVDASKDVVYLPDPMNGGPAIIPTPGATGGDIAKSRVIHRPRKVVVKIWYRAAPLHGEFNTQSFRFRTRTLDRTVTLSQDRVGDAPTIEMLRKNGSQVPCHLRGRFDEDRATARVVVPRSCLGRPRWVRVGMLMDSYVDGDHIDDALRTGWADDGRSPVLGPRVRR